MAWLAGIFDAFMSWIHMQVATIAGKFLVGHHTLQEIHGLLTAVNGIKEMLSFANTVFPVVEFFMVCALLSTVWVAAAIYRLVKSWLPTLS
jgi:hypothetical protein